MTEEDIHKLLERAEQGDSEAQYQLGKLYYSGENVKKNYRVAFEWYKKAAESGHVLAQRMVAEMLLEGSQEIKKNRKLAFYWMQCAAMQDDTTALERLGDMYAKGEGCVKDQNKAIEWYEKAAFKNNPIAQCKLGEIWLPIDIERSKEWFKMAASLNHPWGYSKLWKISLRIEKNVEEAEYWFQKLYSINEIFPWIIGIEYLKESVADKAEEWFKKALEKDETRLIYIGNAFRYYGFYEKAFEWYMKSVQKGYKEYQYELGVMCEYGEGTAKDLEQALFWYKKALDDGDENARKDVARVSQTIRIMDKIMNKDEDAALQKIVMLSISKRVPVMIFVNASVILMERKLVLHITGIDKEKLTRNSLSEEEWKSFDEKTKEICDAPLWINDSVINSIDDYKSLEECIKKERIGFIFFDTLPASVDKKEIIKWSQEIGVNICFTEFSFND